MAAQLLGCTGLAQMPDFGILASEEPVLQQPTGLLQAARFQAGRAGLAAQPTLRAIQPFCTLQLLQPAQHVHVHLCRTGNGASQPTGTGSSAGLRANPTRSSAYFQHTHLDKYMPFMAGMGYVLSSDLAHTVLGFNQEQDSGGHQGACEKLCRVPSLAGTGYELIDRTPSEGGLIQEKISSELVSSSSRSKRMVPCQAVCGTLSSHFQQDCVSAPATFEQMPSGLPGRISVQGMLCAAPTPSTVPGSSHCGAADRWGVDLQCGGLLTKMSGTQFLLKMCTLLISKQRQAWSKEVWWQWQARDFMSQQQTLPSEQSHNFCQMGLRLLQIHPDACAMSDHGLLLCL